MCTRAIERVISLQVSTTECHPQPLLKNLVKITVVSPLSKEIHEDVIKGTFKIRSNMSPWEEVNDKRSQHCFKLPEYNTPRLWVKDSFIGNCEDHVSQRIWPRDSEVSGSLMDEKLASHMNRRDWGTLNPRQQESIIHGTGKLAISPGTQEETKEEGKQRNKSRGGAEVGGEEQMWRGRADVGGEEQMWEGRSRKLCLIQGCNTEQQTKEKESVGEWTKDREVVRSAEREWERIKSLDLNIEEVRELHSQPSPGGEKNSRVEERKGGKWDLGSRSFGKFCSLSCLTLRSGSFNRQGSLSIRQGPWETQEFLPLKG
ncbi:hypothetical protein U0070_021175 [Myodes glareolus]|uniref:Uncharacterized protein n=1 Tax=Myodes glareolus TaxID=447135 RepID=A0AAW0ILE9_MYOGA